MAHAENRLPFPGGDSNMTKISICQCLFYQLLTSQRPFRTPLLPTPLCHPEHRGELTPPFSLLGKATKRAKNGPLCCDQISISRSEEHTSELQSPCNLVC